VSNLAVSWYPARSFPRSPPPPWTSVGAENPASRLLRPVWPPPTGPSGPQGGGCEGRPRARSADPVDRPPDRLLPHTRGHTPAVSLPRRDGEARSVYDSMASILERRFGDRFKGSPFSSVLFLYILNYSFLLSVGRDRALPPRVWDPRPLRRGSI